jgi:hypothetical protein
VCTAVEGARAEHDMLLVQLDHEDGTSLCVRVEVVVADETVRWGAPETSEGRHLVFLPS